MFPHAGPIFRLPHRLAKRVGFLADVLFLQGAVNCLVWWQSWLVQLLVISEPLVRPVKLLLLHFVGSDKLSIIKTWCNVVFNVQKFQLGGCQARETLALQNNKLDFVHQVFQQMRFHKWNVIRRRAEVNNNMLLQVRDESSFHGLILLIFRFELSNTYRNFSRKQNLESSIGNCFEILHFVMNQQLWAGIYKTFRLFKVGDVRSNRNRARHMARDPNRFLANVGQIALVKITFIVKRSTIWVETFFMRYINSKLLQLFKHSFFVVLNISNIGVFHLSIESTHVAVEIVWRPKLAAARAFVTLTAFTNVENITKVRFVQSHSHCSFVLFTTQLHRGGFRRLIV